MGSSTKDVQHLYDSTADAYAAMMDAEIEQPFYPEVFSRLQTGLSTLEGALLDTSCGSGHMLERYHERYDPLRPLIGVDLSPKMVAIAKNRLGKRAAVQVGDMRHLDELGVGDVAGLLSFFAIHHLEESSLAPTFEMWCRILVPGGFLSLAAWEGEGLIDYGGASDIIAYRYPAELVEAVVSNSGFEVCRKEVYTFPEFPMEAILLEARKS